MTTTPKDPYELIAALALGMRAASRSGDLSRAREIAATLWQEVDSEVSLPYRLSDPDAPAARILRSSPSGIDQAVVSELLNLDGIPSYAGGQLVGEEWVPSPVQLYLANQPGDHLAHVILGDTTFTPTLDGLHMHVDGGQPDRVYTGIEAQRFFAWAFEDAVHGERPRACAVAYPSGSHKSTVQVFAPRALSAVGMHFYPALNLAEGREL